MNWKKFFGWLLRIPLILLNLGGIFAGFYAWQNKINGITVAVPIILIILLVLYISGSILIDKGKDEDQVEETTTTETITKYT